MSWFTEKWWQGAEYVDIFRPRVTVADVDRAIERVATVFDASWTETAEPHPAYMFLLPRGTISLRSLVSLGQDLLAVEGCRRIQSVIKDLRKRELYHSTLFELNIAAALMRMGHAIEFRPKLESGKSADIAVRMGTEHVFLELKRLSESERDILKRQLTSKLDLAMTDLLRDKNSSDDGARYFDIEVNEKVTDLLGADEETTTATIEGAIVAIIGETQSRLDHALPIEFEVPSIAKVRISSEGSSGISWAMASEQEELNRIIRNQFKRAISQLPTSSPGILLFQTGATLDPTLTRVVVGQMLSRGGADTMHISVAIFLPTYWQFTKAFSLFRGFPVFNPAAKVCARDLAAYQSIATLYEF